MENIVNTNNTNLRLCELRVGLFSVLRVSLPQVSPDATDVQVIITNGTIATAYTAAKNTDGVWVCDIDGAQFSSFGKQKYEVAYKLGTKQFWDGQGWVNVVPATTSGIVPQPVPPPHRWAIISITQGGVVNYADENGNINLEDISSIPWDNVTGKPTTFPPSAHAASHAASGSDPIDPDDIGAVRKEIVGGPQGSNIVTLFVQPLGGDPIRGKSLGGRVDLQGNTRYGIRESALVFHPFITDSDVVDPTGSAAATGKAADALATKNALADRANKSDFTLGSFASYVSALFSIDNTANNLDNIRTSAADNTSAATLIGLKAAMTDLPYNYGNYTASSTMTVDDGKISRIYSSGYTYLNINPTVTLPIPATDKTAECVLRWDTGSTVHAPTLALPSGKTAQSYSISGDTPEANAKYEMFVQIVPTSTADTYEVISVTRKLA